MKKLLRTLLITIGVILILPLCSLSADRSTTDGRKTEVIRIGPDFAPAIKRTSSSAGTSYNFSWGTALFFVVPIACFITAAKIPATTTKENA